MPSPAIRGQLTIIALQLFSLCNLALSKLSGRVGDVRTNARQRHARVMPLSAVVAEEGHPEGKPLKHYHLGSESQKPGLSLSARSLNVLRAF